MKLKYPCKIAKFFRPNLTFGLFRARFGLQNSFRVRAGFGLIFSGSGLVRAGFGPELIGPFTTLS